MAPVIRCATAWRCDLPPISLQYPSNLPSSGALPRGSGPQRRGTARHLRGAGGRICWHNHRACRLWGASLHSVSSQHLFTSSLHIISSREQCPCAGCCLAASLLPLPLLSTCPFSALSRPVDTVGPSPRLAPFSSPCSPPALANVRDAMATHSPFHPAPHVSLRDSPSASCASICPSVSRTGAMRAGVATRSSSSPIPSRAESLCSARASASWLPRRSSARSTPSSICSHAQVRGHGLLSPRLLPHLLSPPIPSLLSSHLLSLPLTSSLLLSPPINSLTSPHLTSPHRRGRARARRATLVRGSPPCSTRLACTTPWHARTLHTRHLACRTPCMHDTPWHAHTPSQLEVPCRREGLRSRQPDAPCMQALTTTPSPFTFTGARASDGGSLRKRSTLSLTSPTCPPALSRCDLSLHSPSDLTPISLQLPPISLYSPSTLPPLSLLPLDAPTVANLLGSRSDLLGSRSNLLGSRSAAQAARSPLLARGGHPPTSAPVGAHPRGACGNRAPIRQCPRRPWRRRWGRRRWRWRWRLRWGLWRWRWRWRWRPGRSARRFVCL